ncbi:hypothetical protein V6N11_020321 [Hibiscus sabdariffa]|uniref:Uncharacterized protein n=1 Tax=Hibiscus sabdariffa TaxID=183260 RepID=A0ABR2Q8K6_9ROSI
MLMLKLHNVWGQMFRFQALCATMRWSHWVRRWQILFSQLLMLERLSTPSALMRQALDEVRAMGFVNANSVVDCELVPCSNKELSWEARVDLANDNYEAGVGDREYLENNIRFSQNLKEQGVKRTAILPYLRLGVLLHGRTVVSGRSGYVSGLEAGAWCLGCHLVPSTKNYNA